ncbi:MAG: hypothetical protein ACRBG0_01425 [Lewinella sp.]|uniref:hypothetical protein n=1 Tax=Lewinella sp. TaxID=2004506 RepID=UPI003D6BEC2B
MHQVYDLWPAFSLYCIKGITILFLVLTAVSFVIMKANKKAFAPAAKLLLLSLGFAIFGLVMGLFIGLSENPIVGAVFGPLMTFIGGICLYFFTKSDVQELSKGLVIPISIAVSSFSLTLMIGTELGSTSRSYKEHLVQERQLRNEIAKMIIERKLELADSSNIDAINPRSVMNEYAVPLLLVEDTPATLDELTEDNTPQMDFKK